MKCLIRTIHVKPGEMVFDIDPHAVIGEVDSAGSDHAGKGNAEMHLVEAAAILELLRYAMEDSEAPERERLRPSIVSLLYVAGDTLDRALAALESPLRD